MDFDLSICGYCKQSCNRKCPSCSPLHLQYISPFPSSPSVLCFFSYRPVLSRPNARSLSLLYPQDIWAVVFGERDGETREAQENAENSKTSILTITFFPVTPVKNQNPWVRANDIWAKQNILGTVFISVACSYCLFLLSDISFLLDMADLHILGFLTWAPLL